MIEAGKLSLTEFLDTLFSKKVNELFPNNHFPTEQMMNEFLSTIKLRNDKEIKNILRKFLVHNCSFGIDEVYAKLMVDNLKASKKSFDKSEYGDSEYFRRILRKLVTKTSDVWEGLTWVLDLLPHFPNEAIKAIDAYFLANCQMLPDNSLVALSDCTTIIRTRYINYEHPKEIFYDLKPKDFEFLVASLYDQIGYETKLTKSSYDGGIDIFAEKKEIGQKEKLVIQCKRYITERIGVQEIRNLLGVVTDIKATKGVLVTSSSFSREAQKFADSNPSIELIDCSNLITLLNTYHGTYWINKIDRIINDQKAKKELVNDKNVKKILKLK